MKQSPINSYTWHISFLHISSKKHFYSRSSSSADSRRAFVSYCTKYWYPAYSEAKINDRTDMILAVDHGFVKLQLGRTKEKHLSPVLDEQKP